MYISKSILSIIAMCIIFMASPLVAFSQTSLSDVQEEIQSVQKDIKKQRATQYSLQKKLKVQEEALGKLKKDQQQTKRTLKKQKENLAKFQAEKRENETKLLAQQKEMSGQMQAAYMAGDSEFLKILLSQENVAEIQKNLAYYHYFLNARLDLISSLHETMEDLKGSTEAVEKETQVLSKIQKKQQSAIRKIQKAQNERSDVLLKIEDTIADKSEHLAMLEQNRKALENVVKGLKTKSRPSKKYYPSHGSFDKGKGKMQWPAQGKLLAGYHSKIESSELKLNGVLIAAPQGENVHAIAPGRVVFSQWMSGYGLLMIVDHGDGYMTLYGRNDVVYRKEGDEVSAGDILATVGKSGGYQTPALYFAVRKGGKALDPAQWCRA